MKPKPTAMISFNDWCDLVAANVGAHGMAILSARPKDLPFAQDAVAALVPMPPKSTSRAFCDGWAKPPPLTLFEKSCPSANRSVREISARFLRRSTSTKRPPTTYRSSDYAGKTTARCRCAARMSSPSGATPLPDAYTFSRAKPRAGQISPLP